MNSSIVECFVLFKISLHLFLSLGYIPLGFFKFLSMRKLFVRLCHQLDIQLDNLFHFVFNFSRLFFYPNFILESHETFTQFNVAGKKDSQVNIAFIPSSSLLLLLPIGSQFLFLPYSPTFFF